MPSIYFDRVSPLFSIGRLSVTVSMYRSDRTVFAICFLESIKCLVQKQARVAHAGIKPVHDAHQVAFILLHFASSGATLLVFADFVGLT